MCKECDWADHLSNLNEMLRAEAFQWAEETLTGIRDWVEKNEHITAPQERAIENITKALRKKKRKKQHRSHPKKNQNY